MIEYLDFTEDFAYKNWQETRHWRGSEGRFLRISVFDCLSAEIIYSMRYPLNTFYFVYLRITNGWLLRRTVVYLCGEVLEDMPQ